MTWILLNRGEPHKLWHVPGPAKSENRPPRVIQGNINITEFWRKNLFFEGPLQCKNENKMIFGRIWRLSRDKIPHSY